MKNFVRHSRKGFTLVELIIAMGIFSIMSVMTIMIYFNISENARRLELSREVSETARQITERIGHDIRSYGVSFVASTPGNIAQYDVDNSIGKNSGTNALAIKGEPDDSGNDTIKYSYIFAKKDENTLADCNTNINNNQIERCGLYLFDQDGNSYNLVDAFREEVRKRVTITDLKFYVTGDNLSNTPKVTLKMTLQLMPNIWVPQSLLQSSKMEIQTTFSERPYKIE